MGIPVCSDTGCITKKFAWCGDGLTSQQGGPCASEISFDWPADGQSPRALAWGDGSVMAIPSTGLPACSTGKFAGGAGGARGVVFDPANAGVLTPVASAIGPTTSIACDGKIGTCPSCIFVELGVNLCNASAPNVVPVAVEEALSGVSIATCSRIWILHLACPWKGKLCVSFCCDDPTG